MAKSRKKSIISRVSTSESKGDRVGCTTVLPPTNIGGRLWKNKVKCTDGQIRNKKKRDAIKKREASMTNLCKGAVRIIEN